MDYVFLTDNGTGGPHELTFEPFNALDTLNDYEVGLYPALTPGTRTNYGISSSIDPMGPPRLDRRPEGSPPLLKGVHGFERRVWRLASADNDSARLEKKARAYQEAQVSLSDSDLEALNQLRYPVNGSPLTRTGPFCFPRCFPIVLSTHLSSYLIIQSFSG